jgi:hypothetical protein
MKALVCTPNLRATASHQSDPTAARLAPLRRPRSGRTLRGRAPRGAARNSTPPMTVRTVNRRRPSPAPSPAGRPPRAADSPAVFTPLRGRSTRTLTARRSSTTGRFASERSACPECPRQPRRPSYVAVGHVQGPVAEREARRILDLGRIADLQVLARSGRDAGESERTIARR